MMEMVRNNALRYFSLAAVASLTAVVLALAFMGWQHFSTEIFLSAIESGLAWCL